MTIRRLFGTLLALAVALAVALFGITVLQSETAAERTDAEHDRVTSFALSDQMRQSSNDLTRMVRLYVTTGEERYRRHYDEILAIRRGEAPRPRRLRLLVLGSRPRGRGRGAHRPAPEPAVADARGGLRGGGVHGAQRVARRLRRARPHRTRSDASRRDYNRLVDDAYHAQKGTIMAAIERFTRLVDARTAQRSDALTNRTDRLLVLQTLTLIAAGGGRRGAVHPGGAPDRPPARAPHRRDQADHAGRLERARAGGRRGGAQATGGRLQRDDRRRRARPRRAQGRRAAAADDRRPRPRRGLPLLRRRGRRARRPLLQPRRRAPGLPLVRPRGDPRRPRRMARRHARRGAQRWHLASRVPRARRRWWDRVDGGARARPRRRALRLRRRHHRTQGARAGADAPRARRPRAPTAPSPASWPRSATSCGPRSSPSPARSTCCPRRRSPPSSATSPRSPCAAPARCSP